VARYLGAFGFGQLSLALTLFYTFQVFSVLGLNTLITKEVAKDRTKTGQYLVNGSMVVIISSLLSIIILLFFVRLIQYSNNTASLILLLSLSLLPYSLSIICQAVFQAHERMRYIAYANVPVNILKISLAFLLLSHGYGLYQLVTLLLVSHVAVLCIDWWLILHHITKPQNRVDPSFSVMMIRSSSAFLGISGLIAIRASLNTLLLSRLVTETEVGLYNASIQFLVPLILVYESVALSVFPMMCRRFGSGLQTLKGISENLIELLLAIAMPITIGLFFLAESALLLLYGEDDFILATGSMRIVVWVLIPGAFTHMLGTVLWASQREKTALRIVMITTLVWLVSGFILVSQFGLIGAAINLLLMQIFNFLLHYVATSNQLLRISLGRLVWKPLVASAFMALYLALMSNQRILLTILSAGAIYVGILLGLTFWSAGGPRQLKARYLAPWSE
jgi:O-antigen/teichoic acid export membrane protein